MILRLDGRAGPADMRAIAGLADDRGLLLWHALEIGATRAELVAQLTQQLAIDGRGAAASTDRVLAELRHRGLIVES